MKNWIKQTKKEIDHTLERLIPFPSDFLYKDLFASARYSLLSEGKRLRPLLVLAVAEGYNVPQEKALLPACALEMVHTYSLIHDDLPCMDDDLLRRGKPTLHQVYPEWHALLTGDYLLTYAFEVLATAPDLTAEEQIALVRSLSYHSGAHGMIGGQMIDLLFEGQPIEWDILEAMHRGKTAGLIMAALEFGGILGNAPEEDILSLKIAGLALGIAFQLIDDVLDSASPQNSSDMQKQKATATALLGTTATETKAHQLLESALEQLEKLPCSTSLLRHLFDQMIHRTN